MGYYDLLEYCPEDFVISSTLDEKLEQMGISEQELWDMVYEKLNPIIDQAEKEFQQTEEYKTDQKHKQILDQYHKTRAAFNEIYGSGEYDHCYNIYDELMEPEYLERLKRLKKEKEECRRRSYDEYFNSNYKSYSSSSYFTNSNSNYNEDDKKKLKKIYRVAAKKFHPDVSDDNGEMMKFLTKLKEEWGI